MPAGLTDSAADVVRQLLIDRSLGTDPEADGDWPVFAKYEPDGDELDNRMTVFNTPGVGAGRHQPDGYPAGYLGFNVRVVAVDWATGWAKANAVREALTTGAGGGVRNASVGVTNGVTPARVYAVQSVSRLSDVRDVGKERTSKRNVFTMDGLITVRQTS